MAMTALTRAGRQLLWKTGKTAGTRSRAAGRKPSPTTEKSRRQMSYLSRRSSSKTRSMAAESTSRRVTLWPHSRSICGDKTLKRAFRTGSCRGEAARATTPQPSCSSISKRPRSSGKSGCANRAQKKRTERIWRSCAPAQRHAAAVRMARLLVIRTRKARRAMAPRWSRCPTSHRKSSYSRREKKAAQELQST